MNGERVRVGDLQPSDRFCTPVSDWTWIAFDADEGVCWAIRNDPTPAGKAGPYPLHGSRDRFSPRALVRRGWREDQP